MQLVRLRIKGITRFAHEIDIPFGALGEGLIALVGPNGRGKTTILEAPYAGIHLEYPTRPGALSSTVAHGKNARIEIDIDTPGGRIRTLVAMDAVLSQPKTEAFVFDADNRPLTDGKVAAFRRQVDKLFGSPQLMLSAALSCQSKRGAFLDLSKVDRKTLLAEILDTSGLQRLSELAHERVREQEAIRTQVGMAITNCHESITRLKENHEDPAPLREQIETETVEIERLSTEVQEKREFLGHLRARVESYGKLREQRDILGREIGGLTARVTAIPNEITRGVQSGRDSSDRLSAQIDGEREAAARLAEYEDAEQKLGETYEQGAELANQETKLVAERAHLVQARDAINATAYRVLSDQSEAELKRCREAASIMNEVPCGGAKGSGAGCQFLAGAETGLERIPGLETDLKDAKENAERATLAREAFDAQLKEIDDELSVLRGSIGDLETTKFNLNPLASKAENARNADGRIRDINEQLEELTKRTDASLAALEQEMSQCKAERCAKRTALDDVIRQLEEMEAADEEAKRVQGEIITAQDLQASTTVTRDNARLRLFKVEADIDSLSNHQDALAEKEAGVTALDSVINDWKTLERAFGRDGIQAMEIDAAGPELSDLSNELLRTCFGDRFELEFITQQLKRDGGMKEVFDVNVIDLKRGRDGAVELLSGGEKAIVSEAISLALAIYVGRHSGRQFRTLWRDETAGALNPDNAHRYIQMLRRARDIAGAYQIIFIAQQPEIWQQADVKVVINEGGHITIEQ